MPYDPTTAIHPDVTPAHHVGRWVRLKDGTPRQITGRSIDAAGKVEYTVGARTDEGDWEHHTEIHQERDLTPITHRFTAGQPVHFQGVEKHYDYSGNPDGELIERTVEHRARVIAQFWTSDGEPMYSIGQPINGELRYLRHAKEADLEPDGDAPAELPKAVYVSSDGLHFTRVADDVAQVPGIAPTQAHVSESSHVERKPA